MRKPILYSFTAFILLAAGCGGGGEPSSETGAALRITRPPIFITARPTAVTGMLESDPPELFVAEANGAVRRAIFDWNEQHGGEAWFDHFAGVRSMGAFSSRFERSRHVVVLDNSGDVQVDQFLERGTPNRRLLYHAADATLVTGYSLGWNDPFEHVFVADAGGVIRELDFVDGSAAVEAQPPSVSFGPVAALTAFYNWTEGVGHVIVVTTGGLVYDLRLGPVTRRVGNPQIVYLGTVPGAAFAAGAVDGSPGSDDTDTDCLSNASGNVTELRFTTSSLPTQKSFLGTLGNTSSIGILPNMNGAPAPLGTAGGQVTRPYLGQAPVRIAAYNVLGGDAAFLDPHMGSLPDLEIELSFCLTDDNRAKLQQAVTAAVAGISNEQVKDYFAAATFHSQCANGHERGGIYSMDPSNVSIEDGLQIDPPRLSPDHPLAFLIRADVLRDLTASVFQQIKTEPHSVKLDDYTLSLDSSGHDTISLHVNASYRLGAINIPLDANYTDKLHVDGQGTLLCHSGRSLGAPDEPTVGCMAAKVLPTTVPFNNVSVPVDYRLVDITGAQGFYVEADLF
jgi:hypothetical protein